MMVPVTRRLAPEEKDYYVVVTGTITLPNTVVAPASVQVTALRVRYPTVNEVVVPNSEPLPTGETEEVTMYKVTQSNQGKPVIHTNGTTTYTYRTHDLMDNEVLDSQGQPAHRIAGTLDWKINEKKGRWQLFVKDYASNTVEFKIDKRGQIWGYALEEAEYEAFSHGGSIRSGVCSAFTDDVYERFGLPKLALSAELGVPDEGTAALRFFEMNLSKGDYPNAIEAPPFTAANHVAIQGPSILIGRKQIDSNWNNAQYGPTLRDFDDGVGLYLAPYWRNAISRAPKGELNSSLSLLEEIDKE
jgi:hypothetical protein